MNPNHDYDAWDRWRAEDDENMERLGQELRRAVSPTAWNEGDRAARRALLEGAHAYLRTELGLAHETAIVWSDSEARAGYDE